MLRLMKEKGTGKRQKKKNACLDFRKTQSNAQKPERERGEGLRVERKKDLAMPRVSPREFASTSTRRTFANYSLGRKASRFKRGIL